MWVRSQTKHRLCNVDYFRVCYEDDNDYCIYCSTPGSDEMMILGRYSTEEKALEVLDMIQECLCTRIYELDLNGSITRDIYKADMEVFQIPQDDEV